MVLQSRVFKFHPFSLLKPFINSPQFSKFFIPTSFRIPLHARPRPYTSASAAPQLATKSSDVSIPDDNKEVKGSQWKAAIDYKWMRENKEAVAANIKNRNSKANLDLVLQLYDSVLNAQKEVERLRAERNAVANKMKGKLDPAERQKLIEEGKNLKEGLVSLEEDLLKLTDELQQEAQCVPNMTHPDVPLGGEDCSTVRKVVGQPRQFSFPVKDHVQLGKDLDLFDFDAAAEVSGSKFYYLKNEAVMLELGLVNWAVSEVMQRGFIPLTTPEIVRSSVVEKCGFQPRGTNTQVYSIEGSDQCLIGTAEIPVGGIHMDSILSEVSLPVKYVAFSHCFRTEAGAAGAATRGLYRVHQFSKVAREVSSTVTISKEADPEGCTPHLKNGDENILGVESSQEILLDVANELVNAVEILESEGEARSVRRRVRKPSLHKPEEGYELSRSPCGSVKEGNIRKKKGKMISQPNNLDTSIDLGKRSRSSGLSHGQDLVNLRIQVWWPRDKSYYSGTIVSFDSSKKKHKVLYDDGETEILNMDKEIWEALESQQVRFVNYNHDHPTSSVYLMT
ncbi:serine--tRNA ligase, mitochondrial [Dorcoceras hygrometricum]|uniref:serine--tRNA ligase n=1 Tax=Dorcoceras hygrometricum TaxID=472368 RepID=A0A2Z7ALM8_9LAMI|nr:serine--tRNA ligase, mitochondrial [Dorcoceras hygrometricum]